MAKTALALLDLSGYREGVSKENMKKSAEVLKKALYQGNYIGMDTLVMAYLNGDIVEKDTDFAKSLIEIRKVDNSIETNEDTLNRVHFLEAMVEYFTDNKAKAFEGLKALDNKEYVEGIENLGLLCAQEGNSVEAEKYLKKLDELKKAGK